MGKSAVSFPKNTDRRRAWVAAVRRKDFVPSDSSVICSCHFRPQDFDRTGQTVRLRDGVTPSEFSFPEHLCKVPSTSGSTRTSQAALQSPDVQVQPPDDQEESTSDHQYALDLIDVKQKLTEAQERVDELQRKLRNSRDRERRHTKTMKSLLQDLKEKNLLTEELQHKLDSYSDLPVELFKKDCVFTQAQREFSLTLHLHGPKAYKYLRETMKIPLPHPHTLQSALNKSVIGCVRVFYN
ncbi:hypothetical protein ABVT39_008906 [Epinephelus coioides]